MICQEDGADGGNLTVCWLGQVESTNVPRSPINNLLPGELSLYV